MKNKKKVCIITLGCKTNQYESQAIGEVLETDLNFEVSYKLGKADIYILNSCAVTNEAEKKSRQTIAKFNKLNPNCKIFVCGCASQNNPSQFTKLNNVKFVIGNANILSLVNKMNARGGSKVAKFPETYEEISIAKSHNSRVYIKVQDGCNRFCSYCLIPYLRGRSRSRNMFSILKEVDSFAKLNVKEIVLTGIDISDYKIDDQPALFELLEQIDAYGIRYRLGSFEPNILTEDFIKKLTKLKNLCPHFHISMQSGSTATLSRMNRKYSSEFFIERVNLLRTYFDNPAITTDLIVGFPGETDKEFNETVKTVKKIKFSQMHIFPYSRRAGTFADKMLALKSNKEYYLINPDIVKKRLEKITPLAQNYEKQYILSNKNKVLNVVVETKKDNYYIGTTENYIKVYIKSNENIIDKLVPVKIVKRHLDGAIGEIV